MKVDKWNVLSALERVSKDKRIYYAVDPATRETKEITGLPELAEDALSLLKEQEAVEPVKYKDNPMYLQCGNCGGWLLVCDKFCSNCGRAVKLNDL